MTCRTASVERVADKTVKAKEQIDKLLATLKNDEATTKQDFFSQIDEHLKSGNIGDGRQILFNSDIKVEYTSEFSLDKIASVITKALDAVAAAKDPAVASPAMSKEALAAYADLVNSVAEAAKTSSTASGSLAFSMTRVSPGLFSFLRASSVNIKDDETFGTEAVTATTVFYRFMQSIDDIKNEAKFIGALISYDTLLRLKRVQAALVDQLASGEITVDVWMAKDAAMAKAVAQKQKELDDAHFTPSDAPKPLTVGVAEWTPGELEAPLDKLRALGSEYEQAVRTTEQRLAEDYF